VGEFDEDEQPNEEMTPHEDNQKYFSMIDEDNGGASAKSGNPMLLMMNMASIDSEQFTGGNSISQSASNTINNKNNRKLKRLQEAGGKEDDGM
jgi:hypothetical protein